MKTFFRYTIIMLFIMICKPMKAQFDAVGINICIFKCSEKYEIKTCCRLLDEAGKKYVIQRFFLK